MSCGQIALREAGIKVNKYFASEIDKHAIAQTQHNFPDTIQLGSVTDVHAADLPHIDLLIGGSPCQGFSFAGKQLNFNDPRSVLFFEYVRILHEIQKYNPGVLFLLENVRMRKECEAVISEQLGLFPVVINSALVSAQNRVRLYWTNIRTKEVADLFNVTVYTDIPVAAYLKKGTQVFCRGNLTAKPYTGKNGVEAGLNCTVTELELLGSRQDTQQNQQAQPGTTTQPQPYPAPGETYPGGYSGDYGSGQYGGFPTPNDDRLF